MKRKNIDWTNHFIELIVVFIGITLAFMLNNLRESYKNQQLEKKYLIAFHDDIIHDYTQLDTIINANESKLSRVNQVIKILRNGNLRTDSAMVVIGDMAQIHLFFPKVNTYESIKNSGNLNIITDYKFKETLIKYYQSMEEKKLQESYYKLYINEYVIPFVYENVDFLNQEIINKNAINNYEFNNLILGYYQLLVQLIHYYKNIYEMNKELKLIFKS